jgi:hypothetical protein
MPRLRLTLLIAAACALAVPAVQAAFSDDLQTISHHSSSGTGSVGEATEVGIDKPERVLLKIRTKPNVLMNGRWVQACHSSQGDKDHAHEKFESRSKTYEIPTFFEKTESCLFYAEAHRANEDSGERVKLSIRVLAAERPGAAYR